MDIENLLIVINDQDDGEIVLQKAQSLSANTSATLHVVQIIYEGFAELSIHDVEHSHELKDYLMTTATDWLEHLVAPLRDTGQYKIPHYRIATNTFRLEPAPTHGYPGHAGQAD
jgi:hypothetical protein